MLPSQKQVSQFKKIFSTYELHEILLDRTHTSDVNSEFEDLVEVSEESLEINEMEIGKIYLCL
jgi:hypothetical protein